MALPVEGATRAPSIARPFFALFICHRSLHLDKRLQAPDERLEPLVLLKGYRCPAYFFAEIKLSTGFFIISQVSVFELHRQFTKTRQFFSSMTGKSDRK
jgi:hypothetical protein